MPSYPRAVLRLEYVVPAGDWYGVYEDGGELFTCPLVGWGMTGQHRLIPLDARPDGQIVNATHWGNFVEVSAQ